MQYRLRYHLAEKQARHSTYRKNLRDYNRLMKEGAAVARDLLDMKKMLASYEAQQPQVGLPII